MLHALGGNLPYAAVGLKVWGETAGLVCRIGEDFPVSWLERFYDLGFDLEGVTIVPGATDSRRFIAYEEDGTAHYENAVQHFVDRALTYPPGLLGYRGISPNISSRTTPIKQSIQISDIPRAYLEATAVHICPVDYLSHVILPTVFRRGQASTITLTPAPGYMDPSFWEEIPGLLSDLTAFIASEEEARHLFQGRSTDLWEMAEALAGYGPEFIVFRQESWGHLLYDRVSGRRWIVPGYQSRIVDPTGAADAFAGGFLTGYRQHYDPLEAALMGGIAASLVLEGSGVFYALEAMPGLAEARKSSLKKLVRAL